MWQNFYSCNRAEIIHAAFIDDPIESHSGFIYFPKRPASIDGKLRDFLQHCSIFVVAKQLPLKVDRHSHMRLPKICSRR
ncbi:hypothetical protein MesoLj131a_28780 [Mesorhizobium sp. 131-2-1]|nr:hypothetical protein MesoLj131a_28780 [Mesorhizobium sp. 131-2-1]